MSGPARPAWVPDDRYPFESRYADVAGSRVHYSVRWRSPWQRHRQVLRTAIQSGKARQPGRGNSESTI